MNVHTKIPDRRDPTIERWLEGFGISDAALVVLPLSDINVKKSRSNQARIEPLMEDHVERLRIALRADAVFPPLICTDEMVLLDGNHRHEALTLEGFTEHPMYQVIVRGQRFIDMAVAANTLNGQPNTDEERRLHAVQLADTGAYTFTQIAPMIGLSEAQVSDAVHAASVRRRVGSKGAVDRVAPTSLAMLDQISADGPLLAAVEAVDATGSGQVAIRKLVSDVKKTRSEAGAHKAIEAFVEEQTKRKRERRKPKGAGVSQLSTLRRAITSLKSLNPTKVAMEANGSRDSLVADLGECVEKLSEIESAL